MELPRTQIPEEPPRSGETVYATPRTIQVFIENTDRVVSVAVPSWLEGRRAGS